MTLRTLAKWYRGLWTPKYTIPPYSHVNQVGDPILRQKCLPVPKESIGSSELNLIINQMIYVLRRFDCVGLSAPQIGICQRIIAMEFNENNKRKFSEHDYQTRQMETLPLTILINPLIKVSNYKKTKFLESCASVKGYMAEVDRYNEITVNGLSPDGKEVVMPLKGWNSRIAQHEIDHLDGKLYVDIMDSKTFACACWDIVNTKGGRVEIPFYPKKASNAILYR